MNDMTEIFRWVLLILIIISTLSIIRLFLGPTPADRVVAFDTMNTFVIASMVAYALASMEYVFIDVAIVYALLSYIGTLYIAKYLEGDI